MNEIAALPAEAQRQVADFIAYLKKRSASAGRSRAAKRDTLASEPFIGMWKDRTDMEDSVAWVRSMREREWSRRG